MADNDSATGLNIMIVNMHHDLMVTDRQWLCHLLEHYDSLTVPWLNGLLADYDLFEHYVS